MPLHQKTRMDPTTARVPPIRIDDSPRYKICFTGPSNVGKSALFASITGRQFEEGPTISPDGASLTKRITLDKGTAVIHVKLHDTAGEEKYRGWTPGAYTGAHALIAVFDITNEESYIAVLESITFAINNNKRHDPFVVVVGNKIDLCELRQVSKDAATELFDAKGYFYIETSAIQKTNVNAMFDEVCRGVHMRFGDLSSPLRSTPRGGKLNVVGRKLATLTTPRSDAASPPRQRNGNCGC